MILEGLTYRYPGVGGFVLGPLTVLGPADRPWLWCGPSGSGKSTVLRLLSGQLQASAGRLGPMVDKGAYLPQFPESVLVGRNLAEDLCGEIRPDAHRRAALRRALSEAGLVGKPLSRHASELSQGERRQVALALLGLSGRSGWALDEPDAGLDRLGMARLLEFLGGHLRAGGRLWLASHRHELYRGLEPWLLVLDRGRLVAQGELSEILKSHEVRELFGVPRRPGFALWRACARDLGGRPDLWDDPTPDTPEPARTVRKWLRFREGFAESAAAANVK